MVGAWKDADSRVLAKEGQKRSCGMPVLASPPAKLTHVGPREDCQRLRRRRIRVATTVLVPMDSPLVNRLFRQLFSHRASQCLARGGRPALAAARIPHQQRRTKATRLGEGETRRESRWTPRRNAFPHERSEEFERYPMVTSDMLRNRRERPRRVKMLLRDFIEGRQSLY